MSKIPYNHKAIEKKWRDKWEENPVNVQFDENGKKKEKYAYSRLLEKRVIQLMQKMNGKSEVTYEKSGIIF